MGDPVRLHHYFSLPTRDLISLPLGVPNFIGLGYPSMPSIRPHSHQANSPVLRMDEYCTVLCLPICISVRKCGCVVCARVCVLAPPPPPPPCSFRFLYLCALSLSAVGNDQRSSGVCKVAKLDTAHGSSAVTSLCDVNERRVCSLAVSVRPPPPFFSRPRSVGPASSCMKRNQLFLLFHLCCCPKSSPMWPGADHRIRPGLLLCSELACFLTPGAGPNASAMS